MGGKKKYIEMFGSFTEPFNCYARVSFNHNFRKIFLFCKNSKHMEHLPNYVVDVQYIDVFKVRLDKFGHNKKLCLTGLQT